jgi:hypothetical protein
MEQRTKISYKHMESLFADPADKEIEEYIHGHTRLPSLNVRMIHPSQEQEPTVGVGDE